MESNFDLGKREQIIFRSILFLNFSSEFHKWNLTVSAAEICFDFEENSQK